MIRFCSEATTIATKELERYGFCSRTQNTPIPRAVRERERERERREGGSFVVLFEAATEIIHIHARPPTAHCRLVVAMLLIGGSYERDDRQVEISYHWLSAHYANIHSECQTDTVSRSCLSRFAKAFLRLFVSLTLTPSVSFSFSLRRYNCCIQTHVCTRNDCAIFGAGVCFAHSQ